MANPVGIDLPEIIRQEKELNITPKRNRTLKQRRNAIRQKRYKLNNPEKWSESQKTYREGNRDTIRERGRKRVRTPAQHAANAALTAKRRKAIKAALERYPSRRTARQKELVAQFEREMELVQEKRKLTKQEKKFKEIWRKRLTPEQAERHAVREAMAIWRTHKAKSARPYVDADGIARMGSALSQSPEHQKQMIDSIIENKRKWFREGGELLQWDHILASKATDLSGNRIASGYTTPPNMRFIDEYTNKSKNKWISPKLLKSIEKAQMKFLKSKGLMNPMAWPSMLAGFGLIAASPEDSMASMVGEGLIAAGDPLTTVLSGPSKTRNPNYMGSLSKEERKMVDPTWSGSTAINTPPKKKRENIWT